MAAIPDSNRTGGGPKLVVRNTFLEFSDENDAADGEAGAVPRRPRAQTDFTGTKVPRKVSYHVSDESGYSLLGAGSQSPGGCFGGFGSISEGGPAFPGFGMPGDGLNPLGCLGSAGMSLPYGGLPMPGPWPFGFPAGPPGSPYGPMPGPWGYPSMPYPPPPSEAPMSVGHASASWPNPPAQQMTSMRGGKKGGKGGKLSEGKGNSGQPLRPVAEAAGNKGVNAKGRGRGGATPNFAVPARSPLLGASAAKASETTPAPATTVMLRNIPNRYTQELLLQLLNEKGFHRRYDFVYLPIDFRHGVNLGYAFVNLLCHEDALQLTQAFQGYGLWTVDSSKVCEVSWAHPHQGLEEHVERYRKMTINLCCFKMGCECRFLHRRRLFGLRK